MDFRQFYALYYSPGMISLFSCASLCFPTMRNRI